MENIEYTISRIIINIDDDYLGTGNYEVTVYGFEKGYNLELELESEECISLEEVFKYINKLDKVYLGVRNLSWTGIFINKENNNDNIT